MDQDVTKYEEKLPQMTASDYKETFGVGLEDLVLPKIFIMQNTSEMVGDGKAKLGDLINGTTNEVIGGFDSPLQIVPLKKLEAFWVYSAGEGKAKFLKVEEATAENKRKPFEAIEDGQMVKRFLTYTFRVLLLKDIRAGKAFPHEISLKSSSLKAGRMLASLMATSGSFGFAPFSKWYFLETKKEKKETNYYARANISGGTFLPKEEYAIAMDWHQKLRVSNVADNVEDDDIVL